MVFNRKAWEGEEGATGQNRTGWSSAGRWERYLHREEVQIALIHMPNAAELEPAAGPPRWRCRTFSRVENLFHMPVEFLPRGCVPARRGTCALNCQGVMMPRRGPALLHLCPCLVCYQTKYSRAHRDKCEQPLRDGQQPVIILNG